MKENESGDETEMWSGEDNCAKTLPERPHRGHWKYYHKNKNKNEKNSASLFGSLI
jgi:hypothetical protein